MNALEITQVSKLINLYTQMHEAEDAYYEVETETHRMAVVRTFEAFERGVNRWDISIDPSNVELQRFLEAGMHLFIKIDALAREGQGKESARIADTDL